MSRRFLRFATDSFVITANQVAFSAASLATTAAVVRTTSATDAAVFIAAYALESVAASAARGFYVQTAVLRHEGRQLCTNDVFRLLQGVGSLAVLWLPVTASLALWQSVSATWLLISAIWVSSMLLVDLLRLSSVAFGNVRSSFGSVALYAVLVTTLSLTVGSSKPGAFLLVSSLASLGLATLLFRNLRERAQVGDCQIWHRERRFALSQSVEAGAFATAASGTTVVLARIAPVAAVSVQVASQGIVTPALLVCSGFGVTFSHLVVARQQGGHRDSPLILAWAAMIIGVTASAVGASVLFYPLLARFFGPTWSDAARIVPAIAAQGAALLIAQVSLVRYRARFSHTTVRRAYLVAIFLAQVPVLVAISLGGLPYAAIGYLVSAALLALYWIVRFGRWEFILRSRDRR